MFARLRKFATAENGLVTVEWVALASAVVVGGITLVWLVGNNLKAPANSLGTEVNTVAHTTITQAHP
jgi:Flp pilus assembly pilin Flp